MATTNSGGKNYVWVFLIAVVAILAVIIMMQPKTDDARVDVNVEEIDGIEDTVDDIDVTPDTPIRDRVEDAMDDMGDAVEDAADAVEDAVDDRY